MAPILEGGVNVASFRRTTALGRGHDSRGEVGGDRILRKPKFRTASTHPDGSPDPGAFVGPNTSSSE